MTTPADPPPGKSIVSFCAACGRPKVSVHCMALACTWARCDTCHAITGTVRGQPHAMGTPFRA